MKRSVIYVFICMIFGVLNAAETWTLTNKKNQSIEVDYIFYDGQQLSCRKVGAMNKFKISPDDLSKDSWSVIQESFGNSAVIDLEVSRRTKTSTDKSRSSYSGYYTYTNERKDTEKLNLFDIELSSSSHFTSKVTIETFIFAENEVEYRQIPAKVSMRQSFETVLEKLMNNTEYRATSSYSGTYYKSEHGDDKAYIGVIVLNGSGEEIAEYASSGKIKARMHSVKNEQRTKFKSKSSVQSPKKKKNNNKSAQTI